MNIPDDMQLLITTPNSTIYGNERTVIKQFSPLTMHYVKLVISVHLKRKQKYNSMQASTLSFQELFRTVTTIVMERLPYIFAGKCLMLN